MKTKRISMRRGQTYSFTEIVRDDDGQPVDLTGASVHFAMRANVKSPQVVQLTSESPTPDGWRAGVVIHEQTGSDVGRYTVTLIPADTQSLVALGHSDPWFYETWVEDGAVRFPDISESLLDLYPQVVDVP